MFELTEIDESNWRRACEVKVRSDQVAYVAGHQPVALVILAKCYVRAGGHSWMPYLALFHDEPIGVVAVAFEIDHAHLRHFAIDHRRQGQGLGRMMLDAMIATICHDQPMCRSVIVTTHPENEIALSLYMSAGFRRTGALSGIEPVLALDLT